MVNQTYQDFEWIVVDGGSTDGTVDILNQYKDRIDVFISEPDNGRYHGMNKGIVRAHGYWLNFMNGGDAFHHRQVLEHIVPRLKNQNEHILFKNMNFIQQNGEQRVVTYDEALVNIPDYFYNKCINHQSSFIPKVLFTRYGLYNETYQIVSDWEKWIVFCLSGCRFEHLSCVIADFYDGGVGSCPTENHQKEQKSVRQTYQIRPLSAKTKMYYYLIKRPFARLSETLFSKRGQRNHENQVI
ncbi:MAG: glycosyltransferase family 2 protein [Alphaproteobacteria bacterium]